MDHLALAHRWLGWLRLWLAAGAVAAACWIAAQLLADPQGMDEQALRERFLVAVAGLGVAFPALTIARMLTRAAMFAARVRSSRADA